MKHFDAYIKVGNQMITLEVMAVNQMRAEQMVFEKLRSEAFVIVVERRI